MSFEIAHGVLRVTSDTSKAVAGLGAITGAAGAAGAAVAVLPALLGSVASQGGVVALAFKGVGDALGGYTADQKAATAQSGRSASQEAANARQIRDAKASIADAQKALTRAEVDAAKEINKARRDEQKVARDVAADIRDAKEDQARSARESASAIAAASRKVQDATEAEREAQLDLADAYEKRSRQMDDLREKVDDFGLSQEDAAIRVEEAELDLLEVQKTALPGSLELRKANLDLAQARERQSDLTREQAQATAELTEEERKGADGSDVVLASQDKLDKARRNTADAEANLSKVRSDASDKAIAAAQRVAEVTSAGAERQAAAAEKVAQAQAQGAEAQQDAADGVADAVQNLADIQAQQSESASSAAGATSQYAAAMSKLSPAAQAFVGQLISMRPLVDGLSDTAATAFLPGLTQMLKDSEGLFPIFNTNLQQTGQVMGGAAIEAGNLVKSPLFQGQLEAMLANGLPLTESLTGGIVGLLGGIVRLGAESGPAVSGFATGLDSVFGGLNGLFIALEPGMAGFGQILNILLSTVGVLLPVIGQLASLGAQIFGPLLVALFPVVQMVASFIAQLITGLMPIVPVLVQLFGSLGTILTTALGAILPVIAQLFMTLVAALMPLLPPFVELVRILLPPLASLFTQVVEALAPILPLLATMIVQIVNQLLPYLPSLIGSFIKLVQALLPILPPVFQLISALLPPLLSLIGFLAPAVATLASFLADKLGWVVQNVIIPILNSAIGVVRALGDIFNWLLNNVVRPVWNGLMSVIKGVWEGVIQPVFGAFTRVITGLADSFTWAVGMIKNNWDRIKQIAAAPINFVIDMVYNRGIVPVWNGIAGLFGLGRLNPMPLVRFATGGIMPGYTPGVDNQIIAVGGGEAIMRPEWTRAAGADYVNGANAAARSGGVSGAASYISQMGLPGFAEGGIVGDIWEQASGFVGALFSGDPAGAVRGLFEGVLGDSGRTPGRGGFRDAMMAIPGKLISAVIRKAQEWISGTGGGGAGVGAALAFAKSQAGKPYGWGAVGPNSYDCSGFMSAIANVIQGKNPYSRRGATATFPWSGFSPGMGSAFTIGSSKNTGSGIGHMAGTLAGINVESRGGGVGVLVGGRARGTNDPLFNTRAGMQFDLGGIASGAGYMQKNTLDPERVLSPTQTGLFERLVSTLEGGRGAGDVHVHVEQTSGSPAETGRFAALALRTVG